MPKKIRFLVDVGVGKKVQSWLMVNGYDVKCVRDINPSMSDDDILISQLLRRESW